MKKIEENVSPEGSKVDSEENSRWTYAGAENLETATKLKEGEVCKVTGVGNSMTPILKSRQAVICEPVTEETVLEKKNIVLCKVKGHFYLHLIWATRVDGEKQMYLIGNNHGHANGWIPKSQVFGKVVEIL
jgi:hypothetical protein